MDVTLHLLKFSKSLLNCWALIGSICKAEIFFFWIQLMSEFKNNIKHEVHEITCRLSSKPNKFNAPYKTFEKILQVIQSNI